MTTTSMPGASAERLLKPLSLERRNRAIALLDEWMADESGYDESTWPDLKKALNCNREAIGAEKLFDE
jgi:hypothetical protein